MLLAIGNPGLANRRPTPIVSSEGERERESSNLNHFRSVLVQKGSINLPYDDD